ncbi:YolD-like family protein [Bacillus sp. AFS031507]|uniref:YolD-like family protein n=1 Tax=Bacillus sp. AFS031507 TaxID=2033496 RepID=UPI000BFC7F59|nr:hypothetical protein COE25_18825 [Bacillus sp. AFS031507]
MPLIDDSESEEYNQSICYAMEYNLPVRIRVWADGFTSDITGHIHWVDPFMNLLRVEVKTGEYEQIVFEDVIGVTVVN